MTRSNRSPAAAQAGSISAALPDQRDRDGPRRRRAAARAQRERLRRVGGQSVDVADLEPSACSRIVDLDRQADPLVHGHGQGLCAAHPAEPGREDHRARAACPRNAAGRLRRTSRRCPAGSPASRCRSTSPAVIWPYIIRPARSSSRKSSQVAHLPTRLELAMSTRGAHGWVRTTPDRLARLDQQRLVRRRGVGARGRSRRRRPSCGPPDRSRRRPPGCRDPRPPPGPGCSSAFAGRPPAPSRGRSARCREGRGLGARRSSVIGAKATPRARPASSSPKRRSPAAVIETMKAGSARCVVVRVRAAGARPDVGGPAADRDLRGSPSTPPATSQARRVVGRPPRPEPRVARRRPGGVG